MVGGISGGGINNATIDANIAKNAVENNRLSVFGANKYQQQIVSQWIKNITKDSLLGQKINTLQDSNQQFNIVFIDMSKDHSEIANQVAVHSGALYDPSNNTVYMNNIYLAPNQNNYTYKTGLFSGYSYYNGGTVFTHELLGHGYDDLTNVQYSTKRASEPNAIELENRYNNIMGYSTRW